MNNKNIFGLLPLPKAIFALFLVFALLFACDGRDKVAAEIAKLPLELELKRFDREFANAGAEGLPQLRKAYPYLFPAPDSVWTAKMQDSLQRELFQEVGNVFSAFEEEEVQLTQFFKHAKYYFPTRPTPKVITVTNDVDYQNRIILADTLLFIGLDNYLGPEHKYYGGFQRYIAKMLDRRFLVSDVASAYVQPLVPRPRDRTFLARMVYFGKQLYLKDLLMPQADDAVKMGYTQEEMDWALANEEPIWRNFMEQEHLYSTDLKLDQRFLDVAPFSKFGLELDIESPGKLGRFIGWQIVRAFMENNGVELEQMMAMPAEELFKKSNYKPRN
ncbi:gliding motility lipoprotein GldB [Maribacter sp. 2307ULW6-5]|uniref:gliding motility lipoprotein GldB n=1 Tax=Maribacter sp. 2307ULW6-5 TaxID=3386275 RepID=UPI0039BD3FEE